MSMSKGGGEAGRPVVLIILDGWGHREAKEGNAIALARTPHWDRLVRDYPMTLLTASGKAVGLPEGQMGNSEVGHLNLGAGRVVPQDIVRISDDIDSGEFNRNEALVDLCRRVRSRHRTLHLAGLIGTGGVHASHHHWEGVLALAVAEQVPRVAIHVFLDGRDSPPTSGADFLQKLMGCVAATERAGVPCRVATVTGRYYAMDRDRRWERIQLAYGALVRGEGRPIDDPVRAIRDAYARDETDEFIEPMVVVQGGEPVGSIEDGDGLFCVNFRADRMRQILSALAVDGFKDFPTPARPQIDVVTMTRYREDFPFPVAFAPFTLSRIVGEVIADAGYTQLRTAETEKYAHVTYFFNGGLETPFPDEDRVLVDSPKVATYDLQPAMSAVALTDGLCRAIAERTHDFVLCNYANGDMVGHTGVLEAAVCAVEAVDTCLGRVLEARDVSGATLLITADHGNCETMIDPETGDPHTAHTTNPVPFLVVGPPPVTPLRSGGILGDIGPTVLAMLGLAPSPEMTGRDLRLGVD